ncbi:MAG: hypothetical protein HY092_03260 [Candidatus Kerfeldbacteria bacterium]|nr:hypothetical protein [Candidatus Kerfeldbacteria bacterium]
MKKPLLSISALAMVAAMVVPLAVSAKITHQLGNPESIEHTDANTIGKFNSESHNTKRHHVTGKVTAVSATSITVAVGSASANSNGNGNTNVGAPKTYTFVVDSHTVVIRKFKGKSSISEVMVGDMVMVWADKLSGGTAKLIWDKSIWWVGISGTISNLDATNKMFTLTIMKNKIEFTTTVKTDASTTFWQGTTAKTFSDLANGQKVTIRGSWDNIGKFLLARKVTWE